MHNPNDIAARPDFYKERLGTRGAAPERVDEVVELLAARKRAAAEVQELNTAINANAAEVGRLRRAGNDASAAIRYGQTLKDLVPLAEQGSLAAFIAECRAGA